MQQAAAKNNLFFMFIPVWMDFHNPSWIAFRFSKRTKIADSISTCDFFIRSIESNSLSLTTHRVSNPTPALYKR